MYEKSYPCCSQKNEPINFYGITSHSQTFIKIKGRHLKKIVKGMDIKDFVEIVIWDTITDLKRKKMEETERDGKKVEETG